MRHATFAARFAPDQPIDAVHLRQSVESELRYVIGKDPANATLADWRLALSSAIRNLIIDPWFETTRRIYAERRKRVYYLSMEFLIGRLLEDAIANLGLSDAARACMEDLGVDYAALLADEPDAALGNGGLGRLAACFLDSMSTVGVAAHGYGIRYAHGLFKQGFSNGWQIEEAEDWLREVHPWEFERREAAHEIHFGGHLENGTWHPAETVLARGYDTPIPGWQARWVNTLRLWSAQPVHAFDLHAFNHGDYIAAAAPAVLAETISRVLYPDDTTPQGKTLRLKQEYFFTAASLADILRRYEAHEADITQLPKSVAIQLNDTHPAIAVPELIRLLTDRGIEFEVALGVAQQTLNYTNHTLMPEALETWPVDMMWHVLPKHMEIVERIDAWHAAQGRPDSVKLIDHGAVQMGPLAFVGAARVNGVSALHTDLMKSTVFRDLHALHPEKIVNQTNGVTPRRWLNGCNPGLSSLITDTIGDRWITDLDGLEQLVPFAEDPEFLERFQSVKRANKRRLARWLAEQGFDVDPSAMFDIQIKRIHEYKRQLMNILEVIAHWNAIRANPEGNWVPRVRIFGGKAAPGYTMAKQIIKLINDVADVVNTDPLVDGRLKVVYPANYNVSMAERLIPAADLSEQISTAGMEASGTGNMKFAMNGALTIGTLDGANVEIREKVGDDNIFIFGMTADDVAELRERGHDSEATVRDNPRLAEVVHQIGSGVFSPDEPSRHHGLVETLCHHDWFLVTADFASYFKAQRWVDDAWRDQDAWARSAVLNTANMGYFSSDRTIRGYARDVWGAVPAF